MTRDQIEEFVSIHLEVDDEGVLLMDGHDDAFVGLAPRTFNGPLCAVYDIDKILRKLVADGMREDEAFEYFDFNIAGGWLGERTPILLMPPVTSHD